MQTLQPKNEYTPSIPYLIFLRQAIKGGYKPSLEEKALLKKFVVKAARVHPRSGFAETKKVGGE